jgi:hypothetical protein
VKNTSFVKVEFDVNCEWEGLPPAYRIYVNDELFSERTWIWTDQFLREMLQIQAAPGVYRVQLVPVLPQLAKFSVSNYRIVVGPGRWTAPGTLEIQHESV